MTHAMHIAHLPTTGNTNGVVSAATSAAILEIEWRRPSVKLCTLDSTFFASIALISTSSVHVVKS